MKDIIIIILFGIISILLILGAKNERKLLNMSNTISPIIAQIAENLGNYQNIQFGPGPAKGGSLIYKRESAKGYNPGCISGIGNFYYIRCYEWGYEDKKLWYRPTHDVPLGCFSCIEKKEILIPGWDEELQNAELGIKYYPKINHE